MLSGRQTQHPAHVGHQQSSSGVAWCGEDVLQHHQVWGVHGQQIRELTKPIRKPFSQVAARPRRYEAEIDQFVGPLP
jgi:hypothetical protein